jgi:hypothetical protein
MDFSVVKDANNIRVIQVPEHLDPVEKLSTDRAFFAMLLLDYPEYDATALLVRREIQVRHTSPARHGFDGCKSVQLTQFHIALLQGYRAEIKE